MIDALRDWVYINAESPILELPEQCTSKKHCLILPVLAWLFPEFTTVLSHVDAFSHVPEHWRSDGQTKRNLILNMAS